MAKYKEEGCEKHGSPVHQDDNRDGSITFHFQGNS